MKKNKVINTQTTENYFTGLFSLYDSELEIFNLPFYAENEKSACAMIRQQIINDPQHYIAFDSDRFHLYHLGGFDIRKGELVSSLRVVCEIKDIVPAETYKAVIRWKQHAVTEDADKSVREVLTGVADKVESEVEEVEH